MSRKLNGWKAIGGYFQRDRTTIMRWHRERGLPVRKMPGGKRSTVYALTDELDQWAGTVGLDDLEVSGEAQSSIPFWRTQPAKWAGLFGASLAIILAVGLWLLPARHSPENEQGLQSPSELPQSPEQASLYLSARENWSQRTPQSLEKAITQFKTLNKLAPDFAPGYVGLAESYIPAREFAGQEDAVAFAAAETAIDRAFKINPDLASAHRARGFVNYWWHKNPASAGKSFRESLRLMPGDPQTNFWYANVLADNGQVDQSLRYFAKSLSIQPGRTEVMIDYAWALWTAGNDDAADNILRELETKAADNPVYHSVLVDVRMARGDWRGSEQAFARYAALRGKPELSAEAAEWHKAAAQGEHAIAAAAFAYAMDQAEHEPGHDYDEAALVASVAGDRGQLLAAMGKAVARNKHWGFAGYQRRIANRWQGDPEVTAMLARLKPASVE